MVSITKLVILLVFISGCAKIDYLWDQGRGQVKMLTKAKKNELLLKDVTVDPAQKEKIKLIIEYKKYFYEYWQREPSEIYNKTYILDQKAVTYLVTASPFNKIEARQECFPFMGCFPYLGFFSEKKAKDFALSLEKEDWVTYIRPVYAYSSLGYFSDPILSSFFYYSDRQLAELIFHELFHTIFFAKNEVNFNENLANYFAKKMTVEYFNDDQKTQELMKQKLATRKKVNRKIVSLVQKLNERYKKENPKDKEMAQGMIERFLEKEFRPSLLDYCKKEKISKCYGSDRAWNNASFVAFLTYEEQESKISELHNRLNLGLKDFFKYIEKKYNDYRESSEELGFESYLFDQ